MDSDRHSTADNQAACLFFRSHSVIHSDLFSTAPVPRCSDYYRSTRPQSVVTVSSWALGLGWTMTVWGTPAGPAARRPPSWWLTTSPWRPTRSSGPHVAVITSPASWSESAYQISATPQNHLVIRGLRKKNALGCQSNIFGGQRSTQVTDGSWQ